uniref:EGF-like domain-containing protein n=1 Tax=Athene cunicularia TaxID=194338 RepID=A0A663MMX4_ATHCN
TSLWCPPDVYVQDGTPCKDMICINGTCTSISLPNYDHNVTKCHVRGVCNNHKNCHCRYGWVPPYCEWEGFGGSIDSGPPPATEIFWRAKVGVAPLRLLLLCIFGVTLIIFCKCETINYLLQSTPSSKVFSSSGRKMVSEHLAWVSH